MTKKLTKEEIKIKNKKDQEIIKAKRAIEREKEKEIREKKKEEQLEELYNKKIQLYLKSNYEGVDLETKACFAICVRALEESVPDNQNISARGKLLTRDQINTNLALVYSSFFSVICDCIESFDEGQLRKHIVRINLDYAEKHKIKLQEPKPKALKKFYFK